MTIPKGISPKATGKAVSVLLFNENPDVRGECGVPIVS